MINQLNLESYLQTAKWKYNTGECPNLYEGEGIIVQFEDGSLNYTWQTSPSMWNWSLKADPYILKYTKVKL